MYFNLNWSVAHLLKYTDLRVPLALKMLAITSFLQTCVPLSPPWPRVVYSLLSFLIFVCILPVPGPRPRIPHCKFSGSGSRERSSKRRGSVTPRRDTLFITSYYLNLCTVLRSLIVFTVLGPALVVHVYCT